MLPPAVTRSLLTVEYSDQQVVNLFQILSGLLHLGNVTFTEKDSAEGVVSTIAPGSLSAIQLASQCLGVAQAQLETLLLERSVFSRGEVFRIHLKANEAAYACDATIKALYESLFSSVVHHINNRLDSSATNSRPNYGPTEDDESFIGVLDIFGFETYERNSFEQLLINFANEALQNTFNAQIFDAELKIYEEENIECVGELDLLERFNY